MKKKKIILSCLTSATLSSLLLATCTTLSGCTLDEKIDEKTRIDTQLLGDNFSVDITNKDMMESCLKTIDGAKELRQNYAGEILLNWYQDRAKYNNTFKSKLESLENDIKNEYDRLKRTNDKTHADDPNYQFQNNVLSPWGGTEESYKHLKLVEAVKKEVINQIWSKSYFGLARKDQKEVKDNKFANTLVVNQIKQSDLNKKEDLERIGFYAQVNDDGHYNPEKIDYSKHPDADYAAIQQYTFDQWFREQAPFFSHSILVKYNSPVNTVNRKLTDIFSKDLISANGEKENYQASEKLPFFGGKIDSVGSSDDAPIEFVNKFIKAIKDKGASALIKYNEQFGTYDVSNTLSQSDKTLSLSYATKILDESADLSKKTAQLALFNFALDPSLKLHNEKKFDEVEKKVTYTDEDYKTDKVNFGLIELFSQRSDEVKEDFYGIDLEKIYGKEFASKLFADDEKHFNGFLSSQERSEKKLNPIQKIANTINFKDTNGFTWTASLTSQGISFQTIDGFSNLSDPAQRKNVLKYRLLQVKNNLLDKEHCYVGNVSDAVFGSGRDLNRYFEDHFDEIVLQLATTTQDEYKFIFSQLKSEKEYGNESDLFKTVATQQAITAYADHLKEYFKSLDQVLDLEQQKKLKNKIVYAVHDYSNDLINNTPRLGFLENYKNGLASCLPYDDKTGGDTHDYVALTKFIDQFPQTKLEKQSTLESLLNEMYTKIASVTDVKIDLENGFSKQTRKPKEVLSNRCWYYSPMIDSVFFTYLTKKVGSINAQKIKVYDHYAKNLLGDDGKTVKSIKVGDIDLDFNNALSSVFYSSKLFASDQKISHYLNFSDPNNKDIKFNAFIKKYWNLYLNDNIEKMTDGDIFNTDDILEFKRVLATIYYLCKDNFKFFKEYLKEKITYESGGFIGYVTKYNANLVSDKKELDLDNAKWFRWDTNIVGENDLAGYRYNGGTKAEKVDYHLSSDNYWKVVSDQAGFFGLQTENSGLPTPVSDLIFNKFADCTFKNKDDINQGVWNSYRYYCSEENFKDDQYYKKIQEKYPEIANKINDDNKCGLYLANQIISKQTNSDLTSFLTKLNEKCKTPVESGEEYPFDLTNSLKSLDQLKEDSLNFLFDNKNKGGLKHFKQSSDLVHIHSQANVGDDLTNKYGLHDEQNKHEVYHAQIRQISRYDIEEWTSLSNVLKGATSCQAEELKCIIVQLAMMESMQKRALSDIFNSQYQNKKIVFYDAALNNRFDDSWVDEWNRKLIGDR